MGRIAVFIIKSDSFKGIEGETAQRISRYLLCGDAGKTMDIFEMERDNAFRIGDIKQYKDYDVFISICGFVFITNEGINALSRIVLKRKEFLVIAPVSNESKIVHQRHGPPFIYQTISVLKWAAEEIYREFKDEVVEVDEIDDFCFAFRRELLNDLPGDCTLADLPHILKKRGLRFGIAKGVYTHRYGDIYESARQDLMAYVPLDAREILDIGSARGLLGEMLKKRQKCSVTGVDIEPEMVTIARGRLDNVICGDIEEVIDKGILGIYDCIICGDVLEHLNNTWKVVKGLKNHLKKGGLFITSVPNVNNWAIIYEMLRGMWNYVPFSILSGAHIRFFTRQTFEELFKDAGYIIREVQLQSFEIPLRGTEFIKKLKKHFPEISVKELEASEIVLIAEG